MPPAPELNNETFIEWLWHLEIDLNERDLWDPIFAVDAQGHRPVRPKKGEPGYGQYRKLASKACSLIMKAAGYQHYTLTEEFSARRDAVGMYEAILDTYAPRTLAGRFEVYRGLILFRKRSGETWQSTVRRSDELLRYMRLMYPPGVTAHEVISDMAMFALLYTLDPSNRDFVTELDPSNMSHSALKKAVLRQDSTSGGQLSCRTDGASLINSTVCSFCEQAGHSTTACRHFERHKRIYFELLSGSTSAVPTRQQSRQSLGFSTSRRRGDTSSSERPVSIHVMGSATISLGL